MPFCSFLSFKPSLFGKIWDETIHQRTAVTPTIPHQHVAANVPGFPTARFDKIVSQQTPLFGVANHQLLRVPQNYRTPPHDYTYTGDPIPFFGGDPINVDKEIAVGTSFSATNNCEVEVETPITACNDTPQASDDAVNSDPKVKKNVSSKLSIFLFF